MSVSVSVGVGVSAAVAVIALVSRNRPLAVIHTLNEQAASDGSG